MFQWLRNLKQRHRNRYRQIFRFDNGQKVIGIDPLIAANGLLSHPRYLPRHLDDAEAGDAMAMQIVAEAACDVFGVQPFDGETGQGLTQAERIDLVDSFERYTAALKKNIRHLATPQPSTDATPGDFTTTTTNDSAPSTCIVSEGQYEMPRQYG